MPDARFAESEQPTVTVVIPARNEALNLGWVLDRMPDCVSQIILVDGQSVDGTVDVARQSGRNIQIIVEPARGKGTAIRTGFAAAQGDYVVMLDADGSMDPVEIPRFVAPLSLGWEVVKGSRFLPSGGSTDISRYRQMGNWALLKIAQGLFGFHQTDFCYGYMALRRSVLPQLQLTATGFEIEAQIAVRAHMMGFRITEVPSMEAPRRNGQSQLHPVRDGIRILQTMLANRAGPSVDKPSEQSPLRRPAPAAYQTHQPQGGTAAIRRSPAGD